MKRFEGRGCSALELVLLALVAVSAPLRAQPSVHEVEPNNKPAEANPISGEVVLYGSMASGDQDGFHWTVSDGDARKTWNFELHGIPGALTVAELVRVEYTDDGAAVAGTDRLMKMGTRDGLTPSVHTDQLLEPGEYLIGIAYAGGSEADAGSGMFRPPVAGLSFGDEGTPKTEGGSAASSGSETSGAYRFLITSAGELSVQPNPGQRPTRESATSLRPGNQFSTFETEPTAWYGLSFNETQAEQRWDLVVRAPMGRDLRARLVDATGGELARGTVDAHGRIRFADLAPSVTTWFVELTTPEPGFVQWIRSVAVGARVEGEEAEPNNTDQLANRVDFSQPVTGRIGGGDPDYFRFTVDEAGDQLRSLRVDSDPPVPLRLCLRNPAGGDLQCRDGGTPLELPDLLIPPGEWRVLVVDRGQPATYSLSLSPQGPVEVGTEVEPNDLIQFANGVPANLRIKGRFHGAEADFFQFAVADEPQLWRFQVIGDGLFEIGYYDGGLSQKALLRAKPGQRRLRLESQYLLPGTHYVRVQGSGDGEYTLIARAIGPPDPNGELEPNDEHNKQRLAMGQTRTGFLAEATDKDYYRFFLANWDHVRLTIEPPADGIVDPDLYWYGQMLGDGQPGDAGESMVVEGLFPPGDYHVVLQARQPSDAEYRLSLERLPRFSCPADCEPNGMFKVWLAAPLPPDLVLEGRSGNWRDSDVYQLPAFDRPTEMVVRTAAPVGSLSIGPRRNTMTRLEHEAAFGRYVTTVPSGEPQRLFVDSAGRPYRLELEFPDGPLRRVTESLMAELSLELGATEVSAYRLQGQRIRGSLEVLNRGAEPLRAEIEAATSDHRWKIELEDRQVTVEPGGRASIPLTVLVPADAWADRPVRVSLRVVDSSGRQVETWRDIAVGREAPVVNSDLWWLAPESLRGGLNAAWIPFEGSGWIHESPSTMRVDGSEVLADGLTFDGAHMGTGSDGDGWDDDERPQWTLDLPGDDPLPVAGLAINHFGSTGPYNDVRQATLLLSEDGTSFEEVLSFETLPIETEQHFALDRPIPARKARLRVESTFEEASHQRVYSSEWKIILEPGFDLSGAEGFDLADPALGGHLVWDWPPEANSPTGILEDESRSLGADLARGSTKDYVIGFHQNRAAQITRVEWRYPAGLEERWKGFERVEIAASVQSSVGPWLPLGEIDLRGSKTTATLDLPEPRWARFVRLTAHKLPDAQSSHEPGLIRIWERSSGPDYRSVLTEWGEIGPRAFYELQAGLESEPALAASGNGTRSRAARLAIGALARGQVSLGSKLENWYRLGVPADQNTLLLELTGDPTVRTVVELEDSSGGAIPVRRMDQEREPGGHRFEVVVEPGSEVFLRVTEPPRNVVFSWDTSASVAKYIPLINNSLVAFSGEVVPGQEAVNLMPFSMEPLLEQWYGEPYMLQTALNDHRMGLGSSSAEWTLMRAARELKPRPGTKAIMVITDGETVHDGTMWGEMREAQPRVFAVQVAGSRRWHQNVKRDWASVNGGHFTQLLYDGEMEVAFDRASTLMHRPAGYTLRVEGEFREAPGPGRLEVVVGDGASGGGGTSVELILDASGSMLQRLEGKRRIAIAKEVLIEAVRDHVPAGTPLALRVFGHKEPDACRTDLEIPLAPLDPRTAAARIRAIQAMNLARTPIADSLAAVEADLEGAKSAVVVLVTDGEETCDGNPAAVITALREKGIQVNLNIVGFAIDDAELAAQFESWAEIGGGEYLGASDQNGLSEAIEDALKIPFTVYDRGGNEVAIGQVGGEPVELTQGLYRVVVRTTPERTFENVEVVGEQAATLTLE